MLVGLLLPTVVGIVLALMLSGDDGSASEQEPPPQPPRAETAETAESAGLKVDRFDSRRAFAELRRQVEMGPRPTGSETARRLAERLRRRLPRGRFEVTPEGVRNVLGRIPGRGRPILLAAHYDTKDIPNFVGANDGAGGTAAVLELARYFRRHRPRQELRFAFFDGEECPDDSQPFYTCGLRGSRHHAERHARRYESVIVLDFIADKDLSIPRDASSDEALWRRLRAAARRVGAESVFPDAMQGEVLDDHTPFLRAGVPAIDLIDFEFPCWHKPCDDMTAVSESSLDQSGETVLELVRTLARRP